LFSLTEATSNSILAVVAAEGGCARHAGVITMIQETPINPTDANNIFRLRFNLRETHSITRDNPLLNICSDGKDPNL
jgi:hypothetical protein